jgi:hypothetical protein
MELSLVKGNNRISQRSYGTPCKWVGKVSSYLLLSRGYGHEDIIYCDVQRRTLIASSSHTPLAARGSVLLEVELYDQGNADIPKRAHNCVAFSVDGNDDYTSFSHIAYRCVRSTVRVARYRERM